MSEDPIGVFLFKLATQQFVSETIRWSSRRAFAPHRDQESPANKRFPEIYGLDTPLAYTRGYSTTGTRQKSKTVR